MCGVAAITCFEARREMERGCPTRPASDIRPLVEIGDMLAGVADDAGRCAAINSIFSAEGEVIPNIAVAPGSSATGILVADQAGATKTAIAKLVTRIFRPNKRL